MFYCKVYTKISDLSFMPFIINCLAIINCILVFSYSSFLLFGKLTVVLFSLSIACIINFFIFEKQKYKAFMGYTLFFGFILLFLSFMVSKPISTKYYEPKSIIKNDIEIILIGKEHTVVDTTLRIYNSKHPYICKNNNYNGFNLLVGNTWYACEK